MSYPGVVERQITEASALAEPQLAQLVSGLAAVLRDRGFPILAVVRPDPLSESGARSLQSITSHAFERHQDLLLHVPIRPGGNVYSIDLTDQSCSWALNFFSLGYRTALVVRVPILGDETFDFIAFTPSVLVRDDHAHACAYEIFRSWSTWRSAIRSAYCPLTEREREALKAVAQGLKGSEACELIGYTERTFRLHVDNAKKKMKAGNVSQAVHRAHLLCGL